MQLLFSYLKRYWPIVSIAFVVSLLFVTNYQPGTFLTGWDNLHPEFSFWINIKRSFFSVWQEYQGLGLLGGMGHASDLVHQLILFLLSFIFPLSLLRYLWTFLMLFTGSLGTYFLLRKVILKNLESKTIPFTGALFYLFNLATIQTFYAPFETFIAHFAFLPWVLTAALLYVNTNTSKHFFFLAITLILATPMAYIPTLFVVLLIAITILIGSLGLQHLLQKEHIFSFLIKAIKLYAVIIIINAFWLLPFLYFTLANSSVPLNAKTNQMATETIFLKNKEFGNIQDVMLLKGFWFNNIDPNKDGAFSYMMAPWKNHLTNPFIQMVGYVFFGIIILGIIAAFTTKKPLLIACIVLFVFSFTMLTTNTFPFSWINILFRKLPLFDQAFRFPFTKFSSLTSLTYAIFFAYGLYTLQNYLITYKKGFQHALFPLAILLLCVFIFPVFKGNLFYEKERLTIPQEYFQLFKFFQKQDPHTRIAHLPQPTFWGWTFYRFGYGGSGFLWHGIQQPILDGAFTVWSKTDENYLNEITYAIYSKNPKLLNNVLQKYQIDWVLLDKNIINPPAPKALFTQEIKTLVKQLPNIQKAEVFGNIEVYQVKQENKARNFVFLQNRLPFTNSYTFGEIDQAYNDVGNYLTTPYIAYNTPTYVYPFRSLFSNKLQKDLAFSLEDKNDFLLFTQTIPVLSQETKLNIPSFTDTETIIPVTFYTKKSNKNALDIIMAIQTPEIAIDNQKLWGETIEKPLFNIQPTAKYPLYLNINDSTSLIVENKETYFGRTFLSMRQDNSIVLTDTLGTSSQTQLASSFFQTIPISQEATITVPASLNKRLLLVKIPKIQDAVISHNTYPNDSNAITPCDNFNKGTYTFSFIKKSLQLTARNTGVCFVAPASSLMHHQGYAVQIKSANLKGKPLHFWLLNEDEKFAPLDTYFTARKQEITQKFILAPQDPFGKGYSLHFTNESIGIDETQNSIGSISIYPIPYTFLTSLVLSSIPTTNQQETPLFSIPIVYHPHDSVYTINNISDANTIILSQSYDNGWKAYQIMNYESGIMNQAGSFLPFLFGQELKNHVLVNNWENGWIIPDNYTLDAKRYTLVVLFLPQYLAYTGYLLLGAIIFYILIPITRKYKTLWEK